MNGDQQLWRLIYWPILLIGVSVIGGVPPHSELAKRVLAKETPAPQARTVAVIPFSNLSNDARLTPLAEAIADLLTVQLARAEGLALVERTDIDRVLREQALSTSTDNDPPLRLGKVVGAQFVLSGSVLEVNGELRIIGQVVEVSSARVVKSHKVTTRPDRVDQAVTWLSEDLMRGLDLELPELTDEQIDTSPEANLHFMRGLGLHFARMPDEAIVCFLKTLAIDPQHARARFWCGTAYAEADEPEHARIELTRFVKQVPQHPLAPRASKWLAESALHE